MQSDLIQERPWLYCENNCGRRKNHYKNLCDACYLRQVRNTPEGKTRYKDQWLRKLYGITINDFEEMLIAQNYTCAICETEISLLGNKTNVDHCHKTGKVRGLLCSGCNTLLALAKDSKDILLNALNYLNK